MNHTCKLLILFICGPAIGVGIVWFGIIFPIVMLVIFIYFAVKPTPNERQ